MVDVVGPMACAMPRMRLRTGYSRREWLVKEIFIVYVIYSGGFIF